MAFNEIWHWIFALKREKNHILMPSEMEYDNVERGNTRPIVVTGV
jgi:hypothetical protein